MPDKSHTCIALPEHGLVALEGRDAAHFAQAQFANDVALLATGHWQWNAWLTAKGRVIALFALLRLRDDLLWLSLPDLPPDAMADRLKRYVFRSKVDVRVESGWRAIGEHAPPLDAERARIGHVPYGDAGTDAIELDMGSSAGPRRLCWLPTDVAAGVIAAVEHATTDDWRAADLSAGLPRLSGAQVERWTPQQLALERLAAFSVKKGCYPGQEIVARTHYLGKIKRHLYRVRAPQAITTGAEVRSAVLNDQACGSILSAAPTEAGDGWLALAVLQQDAANGDLYILSGDTRLALALVDEVMPQPEADKAP